MTALSSLLTRCMLFKNIPSEEINTLLSAINYKRIHFKDNEIVFSPFQKADQIGIILSGCVDIQKLFPDGKMIILDRKESFQSIAEPSIFATHQYYPSTVSVHKTCEILFISKKNLEIMFSLSPAFMFNYLENVSNLTLQLKHKIGILSLDSIRGKIAGYLIHDFKMNHSDTVTLPFSKKAWAEYMDVSRTSLSRELKQLETDGIISFQKRSIHIVDIKKLYTILSL